MGNIKMHDDIIEHTARDAGYNSGFEAGKKRAWDLMGEAASWYLDQIKLKAKSTGAKEGYIDDTCLKSRWESFLYAQQVIRKDKL